MKSPKVFTYKENIHLLSSYTLDYPNTETGGELFGYWTNTGYPVLQVITGPGSKVKRSSTFFNQDTEYLHETHNWFNRHYGMQHLGSWHSHHRLGLSHPSSHDIRTVKEAMKRSSLDKMFIIITRIVDEKMALRGFYFSSDSPSNYHEVKWMLLEGDNPFNKHYRRVVIPPEKGFPIIGSQEDNSLQITNELKGIISSSEAGKQFLKFLRSDLNPDDFEVKLVDEIEQKGVYLCPRKGGNDKELFVGENKVQWSIRSKKRKESWRTKIRRTQLLKRPLQRFNREK